MSSAEYLYGSTNPETGLRTGGRRKYSRPQGLLLSENPGDLTDTGFYVPNGYEINAQTPINTPLDELDQFIILSDDNRGEISFTPTRIETKERMINGRMRSYHVADKMSISVSWDMLPSRAFTSNPQFNSVGRSALSDRFGSPNEKDQQFTSDGGAGGSDILDWYQNHNGSFWVFLAYDNKTNFAQGPDQYTKLGQYNEIIEVFFSDFNYSVVKRGASNHDFWNISMTLEEV